jgi:hypothetical protein
MATPAELKQRNSTNGLRSRPCVKRAIDSPAVSAPAPAPRRLGATLLGAVTGAMLMASPAVAEEVQRECKTDLRPVDEYDLYACATEEYPLIPKGGAYGS